MANRNPDFKEKSSYTAMLRDEKTLILSVLTTVLFFFFGKQWLADLNNPLWFAFISIWLFVTILLSAFAIVRHAESLAELLGEPIGTLILTLSVIGIEVAMISAMMLTGEDKPTLARDTMFAVVMIVLNGMVGISLLVGGWRHHEQEYNIKGASSFLALIVPLAVLGLILPTFTKTTSDATFSPFQAIFITIMSVGLYVVFLFVQNRRHREFLCRPMRIRNLCITILRFELFLITRFFSLLFCCRSFCSPKIWLYRSISGQRNSARRWRSVDF